MVQLDLSYTMPFRSCSCICGFFRLNLSDVKEDIVPDYPLAAQTAAHFRVAEELADNRARVYLRLSAPTCLCRLLLCGCQIGRWRMLFCGRFPRTSAALGNRGVMGSLRLR